MLLKRKTDFKYSLLMFFGYLAYLLLEQPIRLIVGSIPISILHQGFLSSIILLVPLLTASIYLLYKLNFQNSLRTRNKIIFVIPIMYFFFVIAMSFSQFKNAVSIDFLGFLFGLCLVGFTEEFWFRGLLFPKLSSAFSSVYVGAIVSSFLFGSLHYLNLINNLAYINEITVQVISAFCFGILLCGIFYKTKNLIVPALIHAIFNMNALIRAFNYLKKETVPAVSTKQVVHPTFEVLLNQELMFNISCLLIGFALIYHQSIKRKDFFTIDRS